MPGKPANQRTKRGSARGEGVLIWIDRWLVQISAGLVVGVWLASDIFKMPMSQGTQAALISFVGYALLKSKTDNQWRALEMEKAEMDSLVAALERYDPTSKEALEVRRELIALASKAKDGDPYDTQ